MAKTTGPCVVIYDDSTRCQYDAKHNVFGGICMYCHRWSRAHDGADPQGRWRKRPSSGPCAVTYEDGVRCANPRRVAMHGGICTTCQVWSYKHDGRSPHGRPARTQSRAYADFLGRLEPHGATCLEASWLGARIPHRIRCSEGHEVTVYPDNVRKGEGVCRLCRGKAWDAFYVVAGNGVVKFGITSGDPSPRLNIHRNVGLTERLRLMTDMPEGAALWFERQVKAVLRESGARPVRGREYFGAEWTELVTDIVDRFS